MDAYERLLSLASAADKKAAQKFLKPGRIRLWLAIYNATDFSDLDKEALTKAAGISEKTLRRLFNKAKRTAR